MILRGIHIENWRCLGRLELDDLPDGVIVLHGPNRTGKSSLMKALRGCLFDFDHDSSKADIKNSLPWNGSGPPRLTVDFETGGERYRITKVLARRHGDARLESFNHGQWQLVEDSPKEASRKTRALLGAERSTDGVGQLLWLDQGQIQLPAGSIDTALEERLVRVLGVMVTGRDLAFKDALDERCNGWFGVNGKHKPTSPVRKLHKSRDECAQALAEIEKRYRALDQIIQALQDNESRHAGLVEEIKQAREQLAELRANRTQAEERLQQYREAEAACSSARQTSAACAQRQSDFELARQRWTSAEKEAAQLKIAEQAAGEEQAKRAASCAEAERELEAARNAEDAHRQQQDLLEAARHLLNIKQNRARLDQDRQRWTKLTDQCRELEARIRGLPAFPRDTLEALEGNRREADRLRANVAAGSLSIDVCVEDKTRFFLETDEEKPRTITLARDEKLHETARQHARLVIPGWGNISLRRGQTEEELEQAARKVATLDQAFAEQLRVCGGDPDNPACLEELREGLRTREACSQELELLRNERQRLHGGDDASLTAELHRLDEQKAQVLERFPELAESQSDPAEIDRQAALASAEAAKLRREREEQQSLVADLNGKMRTSGQHRAQLAADRAGATATASAARDELDRLGSELTIAAELDQARDVEQQAEARRAALELTEAERTIDDRVQSAESSLLQMENALQDVNNDVQRQRGALQGSEGLHAQNAEAAACLREVEEAIAREERNAEAHAHLRELFEQCRDNQVERVLDPISTRVLAWAHELGLDDYHSLRFGAGYVPEGIVRGERIDKPVPLADESFGTEEQLNLLVRLALGSILAREEPAVAVLDDPLAHTDPIKQRRILQILQQAALGELEGTTPTGPMQIIILTCHPERFEELPGASYYDLAALVHRDAASELLAANESAR